MQIRHLQSRPHSSADVAQFAPIYELWTRFCDQFNAEFAKWRLPIRFNCDHMLNADYVNKLIDGENGEYIEQFLERGKVAGMMFPNQIKTVADVLATMYNDPGKCILVLGAMMCGKTGTAGATRLAGPIFYLCQGVKYYPVQLLPVRKGQEHQTNASLRTWDVLYQDIRIHHVENTDKVISLRDYRAKAPRINEHLEQDGSISLKRYNARIIRKKLTQHIMLIEKRISNVLKELVSRRSRKRITPIQELCQAAQKDGFLLAMIIDEPHWGSARNSMQDRMLARMKTELQDTDSRHIVIGFDATPFQISNAASFAVVKHRLTTDYCGPNCWNGEALDPSVKCKDIILHTFDSFTDQIQVPNFAIINRSAYTSAKAYARFLTKWHKEHQRRITWSHAEYRRQMILALRETVHKLVLHPTDPRTRGICIRLMKTNADTERVIEKLQLDPRIKVIPYMAGASHESVEDTIEREAPDGPYVVFVTGAARMADLFPQHCTAFIDWTETISNQVALMQGSYGRACGYGEPRTVVMNKKSITWMQNYIASKGKLTMHLGPQSTRPSATRQGAPNINIRLGQEEAAKDARIANKFASIQREILDKVPFVIGADGQPSMVIGRQRLASNPQKGHVPFWRIMNESTLRHIERNYTSLLPEIAFEPHILRIGEESKSRRGATMRVAAHSTLAGYGKVGLRNLKDWVDKSYRSDNMQVKGKYSYLPSDATGRNPGEIEAGVQPQLWVTPNLRKKRWELRVIVLRLKTAVPGMNRSDGDILPSSKDMNFDWCSEEQQLEIEEREAAVRAAHAARRRTT